MPADYDYYVALEANHDVRVDDEGYQWVRCPFVDAETPWSPNAGPDEVDCAFCQILREGEAAALAFPTEHAAVDGDADAPIGGGAHGGTHSVYDYRPCRVPNRAFTWAGLTRPIHEGIYGVMSDIVADWQRLGGQDFYEIRSWWGYAARSCSGSSWHERAVAVDVNPAQNPMVGKRTPCPSDMPPKFVQLFKKRGAGHGADWRSKCDAMHFSWGPPEGGDGVLYRESKEEDDMALFQDKAEFKATVQEVLDQPPKAFDANGMLRRVWKSLWVGDTEHLNLIDAEQARQGRVLAAICDKVGVSLDENGEPRTEA